MPSIPSRTFTNGGGQAVLIPRELRLDTDRVEISRTPTGDLLVRPVPAGKGAALLEALNGFDDAAGVEFVAELERAKGLPPDDGAV